MELVAVGEGRQEEELDLGATIRSQGEGRVSGEM
jgi:hypothetical protein